MLLGVIGDLVQDVVVWLEEAPRAATDTRCHITITRGGSAANVAAFAAPHCRTRFIACVGDDLAGRTLVADLAVRGVEVRTQTRARPAPWWCWSTPEASGRCFPHAALQRSWDRCRRSGWPMYRCCT